MNQKQPKTDDIKEKEQHRALTFWIGIFGGIDLGITLGLIWCYLICG